MRWTSISLLVLGCTAPTPAAPTPGIQPTPAEPPPGFVCPAESRPCYTGPAGTENVGPCHGGRERCTADGWTGNCDDQVTPRDEICGSPEDENCDGDIRCPAHLVDLRGYGRTLAAPDENRGDNDSHDGEEDLVAMAVHPDGRTWIAGRSSGTLQFHDSSLVAGRDGVVELWLAQLDTTGRKRWHARLGEVIPDIIDRFGEQSFATRVRDLAVDATGELAVVFTNSTPPGRRADPDGSIDPFAAYVALFSPDGTRRWLRALEPGSELGAPAIALDAADVLVTGMLAGTDTLLLALRRQDGKRRWTTHITSSDSLHVSDLAALPRGPVVLVGAGSEALSAGRRTVRCADSDSTDQCVVLASFTTGGAPNWVHAHGPAGRNDISHVRIDADGLTIAGSVDGLDLGGGPPTDASSQQSFVARLDLAGQHRWTRTFVAESGSIRGLARGADGRVHVAGQFREHLQIGAHSFQEPDHEPTEWMTYAATFTADGEVQWVEALLRDDETTPVDLHVLANGHLLLGGITTGFTFGARRARGSLFLATLDPDAAS